MIGFRLGYLTAADVERILIDTDELGRMLMALVQKLSRRQI